MGVDVDKPGKDHRITLRELGDRDSGVAGTYLVRCSQISYYATFKKQAAVRNIGRRFLDGSIDQVTAEHGWGGHTR